MENCSRAKNNRDVPGCIECSEYSNTQHEMGYHRYTNSDKFKLHCNPDHFDTKLLANNWLLV